MMSNKYAMDKTFEYILYQTPRLVLLMVQNVLKT